MYLEALVLLNRVTGPSVAVLDVGAFHQDDFSVPTAARIRPKQADRTVRDHLVHGVANHTTREDIISDRRAIRDRNPVFMLGMLVGAEVTRSGSQIIERNCIDIGL